MFNLVGYTVEGNKKKKNYLIPDSSVNAHFWAADKSVGSYTLGGAAFDRLPSSP